jgi:hypothetical protein
MPITTPDAYTEKLGDSDHFAHVLTHLFTPAIEEAGLTVISPSMAGSELIHAEIIRNLEQADFVLCDLSGLNPNALFELGVRTSLDRPIILVKDNLTEKAPFDLNAINTLTYDSSMTPWSLVSEKPRLIKHIQGVVNSGSSGNSMWRYFGLTKRGEPSQAGSNPIEAKLDLLIGEFSKFQPTYVGNSGYVRSSQDRARERFIRSLADLFPGVNLSAFAFMEISREDKRGYRLLVPDDASVRLTAGKMREIFDAAERSGFSLLDVSGTPAP